jgi:hypothetical protein
LQEILKNSTWIQLLQFKKKWREIRNFELYCSDIQNSTEY